MTLQQRARMYSREEIERIKDGLICDEVCANHHGLAYIHQLESTYSQVSKALRGKENATLDEVLKAVDQLKSRLAQVEREKDAAVNDLKIVRCCGTCANNEGGCTTECYIVSGMLTGWRWRGVCEENSK